MPVDIPTWTPPWRVVVRDRLIRVSAAHLRGEDRWECPTQIAVKARPTLQVDRDPSVRVSYPPFNSFALGLARDAAYSVLSSDRDPDVALDQVFASTTGDVADAARGAAREALQGYLMAVARLRDAGDLPADTVVREFFAADEQDVRVEWSAWGLLHISRDGAAREFHVLTWEQAGTRRRDAAYLAVYARVAADAIMRQEGSVWRERWPAATAQPAAAERVRVREIGMLDASDALLLDISADEARHGFADTVTERIHVLGGGAFNPGGRCATCPVRYECPGPARMPGVLGVAGPALWTRALSPGDLTTARTCTWQVHLERELSLPRARRETTEAMLRGTHLHSWLEHAHARLVPCSLDDLPIPGEGVGDVGEMLGWDDPTYAALRPYLLQHLEGCPLRGADVVAAYPEQTLTAWDTDVDVVMSTRADLVVETADALPPALVEEAALEEALLNLLINARDAVEERHQSSGRIAVSTHLESPERIVLHVSDDGNGIPESLREHVFEPFFSTRSTPLRAGLGLSIARSIAEHSGGELQLSSQPGEGTLFALYLPTAPAHEPPHEER